MTTGRPPIVFSDPVGEALAAGRAVVALETSVLAQGLPDPRNLEAAERMSAAIADRGAEPAWISIAGGSIRVGTSEDGLRRLASEGAAAKVARRDLPMAVSGGGFGATTVSATLWAADRAGIEVTTTGGIGGVHPGTGDVSADLVELARTPGTLVCSGPKSIVDPLATLERLEELGVGVLGYRCRRLPFFVVRETPIPLEHVADDPGQAAGAARARRDLGVRSALVICNPVPEEHAMDPSEVSHAVASCAIRARSTGVTGKEVTPFLLSCLAEATKGASVESNLALLVSNAALAAEIALALAG
jgi:pseudouridylate synthase